MQFLITLQTKYALYTYKICNKYALYMHKICNIYNQSMLISIGDGREGVAHLDPPALLLALRLPAMPSSRSLSSVTRASPRPPASTCCREGSLEVPKLDRVSDLKGTVTNDF